MSVKITCDVGESIMLEKALLWPLWKEKIDLERREQAEEKGESRGGVIRWA